MYDKNGETTEEADVTKVDRVESKTDTEMRLMMSLYSNTKVRIHIQHLGSRILTNVVVSHMNLKYMFNERYGKEGNAIASVCPFPL